jgi:hypothetical protein
MNETPRSEQSQEKIKPLPYTWVSVLRRSLGIEGDALGFPRHRIVRAAPPTDGENKREDVGETNSEMQKRVEMK